MTMQAQTSNDQLVDTLNGFLRGEVSAVETYTLAIERVDGPARAELEECKRSHQQRVETLRRRIMAMGGDPSKGSGPWGAFTKLVTQGAKVLGADAVIAALEEGEDHGLKLYRDDLQKLDLASRQLVEMELLPAQERTHRALSSLKHTLH